MGLCKAFGCTPSQILDEDFALINAMMTYDNADYAVRKVRTAKGDELNRLSGGSVGRIIKKLKDDGVYKGGLS